MTFDEYQRNAAKTNGQVTMLDKTMNGALSLGGESTELTEELQRAITENINTLHYMLLVIAASGHITEHIKKWKYHGLHIDFDRVVKEMGDVLWSLSSICDGLGTTLEHVARVNNDRLAKRYPDGFQQGGGIR